MAQVVGLPKMLGACITPHSAGGPGEQRQIVRLAGVGDAVGVGHVGALSREFVQVWRLPAARHAGAMLVLQDHHHDVVRSRHCRPFGFLVSGGPHCRLSASVRGGHALARWSSVGSAATTVGGRPLEGAGATVDDGSATAQAADANSNIPAAAQADRGKARTWNPLQTEALAEDHSMRPYLPRATRRAQQGTQVFMAILPAGGKEPKRPPTYSATPNARKPTPATPCSRGNLANKVRIGQIK